MYEVQHRSDTVRGEWGAYRAGFADRRAAEKSAAVVRPPAGDA